MTALRDRAHDYLHRLVEAAAGEGLSFDDGIGAGLHIGLIIGTERPDFAEALVAELRAWSQPTPAAHDQTAKNVREELARNLPPAVRS